jgi:hypothetical protein
VRCDEREHRTGGNPRSDTDSTSLEAVHDRNSRQSHPTHDWQRITAGEAARLVEVSFESSGSPDIQSYTMGAAAEHFRVP